MKDKNLEIGRRIKQRREELGLTQEELGKNVWLNKSTIQRYETGKISSIKLPFLHAMAKQLDVDPNWLALKTDIQGHFIERFESFAWDNSSSEERNKRNLSNISRKIFLIRERYNLTQEQFAHIAGTHVNSVESWEAGEHMPTLDTIKTICQFFKINSSDLLNSDRELSFESSVNPNFVRVLSEEDAAALYILDKLNSEGRTAILSMASAFTGMPQYKKCDTDDADLNDA